MRLFSIILIPLIINISIASVDPSLNSFNKASFIEWGIKNNLITSPYIELSSSSERSKIRFIAKDDIPRKEELLTIPYSLMFNLSKILELINSKSLNKQYKEFSKLNLT